MPCIPGDQVTPAQLPTGRYGESVQKLLLSSQPGAAPASLLSLEGTQRRLHRDPDIPQQPLSFSETRQAEGRNSLRPTLASTFLTPSAGWAVVLWKRMCSEPPPSSGGKFWPHPLVCGVGPPGDWNGHQVLPFRSLRQRNAFRFPSPVPGACWSPSVFSRVGWTVERTGCGDRQT